MKRSLNLGFALAFVFALSMLFNNAAYAQQKGTGTPKGQGQYFIDQNGDGICDNIGTHQGQKSGNGRKGKGLGPQDGTGYKGNGAGNGNGSGVCNGTGGGNGTGTGVCDGTGPKGNANRGNKK